MVRSSTDSQLNGGFDSSPIPARLVDSVGAERSLALVPAPIVASSDAIPHGTLRRFECVVAEMAN